jgi:hypothetical protein
VKGCLERGRELLRQRLSKRGISLPAGLLLTTVAGATAAVPPALVRRAVGSVGSPSPAAVALARGFATTGGKARLILLAACAAGLVGLATASAPGGAGDAPKPADQPAPAASNPQPEAPAGVRTVTGTVHGPDGKPAAGANVYFVPDSDSKKPLAEATTAADGSFRLTFDPAKLPPRGDDEAPWRRAGLIAVADGFGPALAQVGDVPRDGWRARLVEDLPVEGIIRNLEGRPVAGVEVSVSHFQGWTHPGQLDEYLKGLPTGRARYVPAPYWWGGVPGREHTVKTDDRGRFKLAGLGRDRLVTLNVGGAGIARTRIHVLVRPGTPLQGKQNPSRNSPPLTIYPSTFDLPLPPGSTLVIRVVDPAPGPRAPGTNGTPVAGMEVSLFNHPPVWTGRDGRAEFRDVNPRDRTALTITPGPTSATYLGMFVFVNGGEPGLDTRVVEVQVNKGIPIRAKVVEKGSDRPVEAGVEYVALYPNELPPGIEDVRAGLHRQPDGTYLGAALPGPGAVVVRRTGKKYVPAVADQKAFFKLDGLPKTNHAGSGNDLWGASLNGISPMPLAVRQFQAIELINPAKDSAGLDLTLELDPGETKTLRLVDPDGRPLTGVTVKEFVEESWSDPLSGSERGVPGVGRGQARVQHLRHEGRKLAAVVEVKPESPAALTVTLKPWATVSGRLANGDPRLFANMTIYGLPEYATTDKDGRFRIEKVAPDHPFDLWVGRSGLLLGRFPDPVTVKPGQELDLGGVQLKAGSR